jgi:hypothetical protein
MRRRPLAAALLLAAAVAGASAGVALLLRPPSSPVSAASPDLPPPRYQAVMAYDAQSGDVVLFGGDDRQDALADTWSWNGARWRQDTPAVSPPGLVGAMMGYDQATRRVVLTGGAVLLPGQVEQPSTATWTWDGSDWSPQPAGGLPAAAAAGAGTALAADPASGQLILVTGGGGCQGFDTWRWAGGRWTQLHPAVSPDPAELYQLVYDPAGHALLLFASGPICPADRAAPQASLVWAWNGATWGPGVSGPAVQPQPPGLGPATNSAAEPLLQTSTGTYLWDGSVWRQTGPPEDELIEEQALTYDAANHQAILFGGVCMSCGTVSPLDETWTWTGRWVLRGGTPGPPGS